MLYQYNVWISDPQSWFNLIFLTTTVYEYLFISPGGRLNKKDGLTKYGNSHVKDKTS